MVKLEKFVTSLLTIILVILAGLFIWLFQTKWRQPLGPSLATPFELPATWTPDSQSGSALSTLEAVSIPYALSTPENLTRTIGNCGGVSPTYVLVVGSDSRGDNYLYGLADVLLRLERHVAVGIA